MSLLSLIVVQGCGDSPTNKDAGSDATAESDATIEQDAASAADGGDLLPPRPGCTDGQVFVSPTGDDSAEGTRDTPVATLSGARDRVRTLITGGRPDGPITVCLRGGDYVLDESFTLGAEDSGEEGRPIVYQGYEGEVVRILGGARLARSAFIPVTQSEEPDIWDRLHESARGRVYKADIAALRADFGTFDRRLTHQSSHTHNDAMELFYDDEPMTLGRYPDYVDPSTLPRYPESVVIGGEGLSPDPSGRYVQEGEMNGRPYYRREDGEFHLRYTEGSRNYLLSQVVGTDIIYYSAPLPTTVFKRYRGDLGGTPYGRWGRNIGFEYITSLRSNTELVYEGDRPSRWTRASDPLLFGYFRFVYRPFHVRLESIDTAHRTFVVQAPSEAPLSPRRYFAYNLLEEITVPGEYYLDRESATLYFWPPDGTLEQDPWVSVLNDPLVVIDAAEYVTLSGLNFEFAKDTLIDVRSDHVTIEHCSLRNSGGAGLRLRGSNNLLSHSEIANVGGSGVWLAGGDRPTLTPSGSEVSDSRIHDYGRIFWAYEAGIQMLDPTTANHRAAVGNRALHNEIFSGPHEAIAFRGNDQLIAFNDIHHVVRFADDMGAIYVYLSWGARGTRIENNFLHHIQSPLGGRVHGVYLDGTTAGPRVTGNIFYEINPGIAMFHNGGRDIQMVNNIFVRNGTALVTNSSGATFDCSGHLPSILSTLASFDYQSDPWASAYPRLAALPSTCGEYEANPHWLCPEGSVFSRNVGFSNATWIRTEDYAGCDPTLDEFEEVGENLEDTDPLFVDEASLNLALRPDSPLRAIDGFSSRNFEDIGPRP